MGLILLSIILFIVGLAIRKIYKAHLASVILRVAGGIFFVLGILISCFVQISSGQVGVPTLFGKVNDHVLGSGLHLVNPLVVVKRFDVRTENYTMSGISDEGYEDGDDAIRVLTSDGLELTLDVSVLYRVVASQAPNILRTIGEDYRGVIVRPVTRTKIRDNATFYTAVDLYSNKREEFQQKIFSDIESDFQERGLELQQLLVRNITLPESVKGAIELKIQAEQQAQAMEFVLQKELQEAERKRVEAKGISDYQHIINQTLTTQQLQYEYIQAYRELAQSSNSKIIVLGDTKNGVPIILNDN